MENESRNLELISNKSEERNWLKVSFIFVLAALAMLFFANAIFVWKYYAGKESEPKSLIDHGKFQAIFLSNRQVYFGKVSGEKEQYILLSNVYYLVTKQPLQDQESKGENSTEQPTKNNSEYSLVKLGKEMHGPINMIINRDHILFIENLSDDSRVVSAIRNIQ